VRPDKEGISKDQLQHARLLHKEICQKVNITQTSHSACSRITSSHLHIHYRENAPQRNC